MKETFNDFDTFSVTGGYKFSAPKLDKLEGTSYTLASIAADATGSVQGFSDKVVSMMKEAAQNIEVPSQANPKDVPIMLRATEFSGRGSAGIRELHGYKKVGDLDVSDYDKFYANGMTNLYDAIVEQVNALSSYSETLYDDDYVSNACVYIITDGQDNCSVNTLDDVIQSMQSLRRSETIESVLFFLIGINTDDSECAAALQNLADEAKFDKYYTVQEVESNGLGGLGQFISSMTLSQSQSLNTGQASQAVPAQI